MLKQAALLIASISILQAQSPKGLDLAISRFQKAVAADDIELLASVSHFPVKSNEYPTFKNKADLLKHYRSIFTPERKRALVGQVPIKRQSSYSLFGNETIAPNDPIQFLFKPFGHEFKFYYIDNVNE